MGVKILGIHIQGVTILEKFRFPTIIIFLIFWTGVKVRQIALKRSVVMSADISAVLLEI